MDQKRKESAFLNDNSIQENESNTNYPPHGSVISYHSERGYNKKETARACKKIQKNVKTRGWSGDKKKTNTVRPAYCVFCPRHKHSISFPKAFTDSKKTKSEPKKKNTDDDIPQKTDLKIFLEECILLEKANLLFCSFVHFDKFLVAALTHPTCQRG